MQQVGIIGGNSLIGQHLISLIDAKRILVWNDKERVDIQSDNNNNNEINENVTYVTGMKNLSSVFQNSKVVFNLFETCDFSLIPDDKKLNEINVNFVKTLVDLCKSVGDGTKLVHLSSVYLQCSTRWPNIYGREEINYDKFRAEVPFPAYCDSKHRAEQLLLNAADRVPNICARVGAVYGEGDRRSLLCDAILFSKYIRVLPKIGDESGTFQMTYAGNAAAALLKCAEKLIDDDQIRHEVVLITDETPVKNIYDSILLPINSDEGNISGCSSESFESKRVLFSNNYTSFYLFFPIFWILCLLAWCWAMLFNRNSIIAKLPSPYYPYLVMHQWTFYSDFKLRIFFNHKPKFDFETSLARSREYYQQLDASHIDGFSWLS